MALGKILQLEKQLDAKQKLELEIEELKGNLLVMKHMGGEDDIGVQQKMDEMLKELEEKIRDLEALNQTPITQEQQRNDKHQDARKVLNSDRCYYYYFVQNHIYLGGHNGSLLNFRVGKKYLIPI